MQSTTPRGRPALHTAMNLSALTLGLLSLAGLATAGAYSAYGPAADLAAGTSFVGPMLVAVLLLWGLAVACWITAYNTRPIPTAQEQLAAIDSERERLDGLREQHLRLIEADLAGLGCDDRPAPALKLPDARVPSPRRRRVKVPA